jgi:hypothetical protein
VPILFQVLFQYLSCVQNIILQQHAVALERARVHVPGYFARKLAIYASRHQVNGNAPA